MKIRNGFVSNSSSSSFIVGEEFTLEQTKEIMKKIEDSLESIDIHLKDTYKIIEKTKEDYKDWSDYNYIPDRKMIVVENLESNGIPYESFNIIDSKLEATRIHLG